MSSSKTGIIHCKVDSNEKLRQPLLMLLQLLPLQLLLVLLLLLQLQLSPDVHDPQAKYNQRLR